MQSDDLCEIDALLQYIEQATNCVKDKDNDFDESKLTKYKMIDDLIEAVDEAKLKEFTAYMAPRLLGDSTQEAEMRRVVDFLQKYIVKNKISNENKGDLHKNANKTREGQ